jgi:chemotaxis protein CheC
MGISSSQFDQELYTLVVAMANEGIHNAARGMSIMVGEPVTVSQPVVRRVPITDIPTLLGGPENEAVGIYLRIEGTLCGQMMLIIPYDKAIELANLIMGEPDNSNQTLGPMQRSALAELGNLTGSFFLNAVASSTGLDARPSPPAVMVDMVGAILDILLATTAGLSETVLMIQATFLRGGRETQADFWIIPDRTTLENIAKGK